MIFVTYRKKQSLLVRKSDGRMSRFIIEFEDRLIDYVQPMIKAHHIHKVMFMKN